MVSKPIPYRCPACMTESPPSYVGRLVWLEQETGPVLCRYHRDKNGNLAPVEMEAVPFPFKVQAAVLSGDRKALAAALFDAAA